MAGGASERYKTVSSVGRSVRRDSQDISFLSWLFQYDFENCHSEEPIYFVYNSSPFTAPFHLSIHTTKFTEFKFGQKIGTLVCKWAKCIFRFVRSLTSCNKNLTQNYSSSVEYCTVNHYRNNCLSRTVITYIVR